MAILPTSTPSSPPATNRSNRTDPSTSDTSTFSTTEYVLLLNPCSPPRNRPDPHGQNQDHENAPIPLRIPLTLGQDIGINLDIASPEDFRRPRHRDVSENISSTLRKDVPNGKPILRRDSLARRDALLRGKEGSRRRQRWENDRLITNPYFTPPSASDWSPVPLPTPHKATVVRYELARLWDEREKRGGVAANAVSVENSSSKVPKELKLRLKKARGAVGLLKSLEEEVRVFLTSSYTSSSSSSSSTPQESPHTSSFSTSPTVPTPSESNDSEPDKEQITFQPKPKSKSTKSKSQPSNSPPTLRKGKSNGDGKAPMLTLPLHRSPLSDPSASFTRWLIHSIAKYYGLRSWSVTMGMGCSGVRVAYIGVVEGKGKKKEENSKEGEGEEVMLPRPLWGML